MENLTPPSTVNAYRSIWTSLQNHYQTMLLYAFELQKLHQVSNFEMETGNTSDTLPQAPCYYEAKTITIQRIFL